MRPTTWHRRWCRATAASRSCTPTWSPPAFPGRRASRTRYWTARRASQSCLLRPCGRGQAPSAPASRRSAAAGIAFTAAARNFTRELEVGTRGLTGPDASRQFAAMARRHIAEVERQQAARSGGVVPDHTTTVECREGATPEQVRPDGVILITWHYLTEAVIRTVTYLEENGPEHQGAWKASITAFVDDTAVPRTARLPTSTRTEAVVGGCRADYARRLEVGKRDSGGPFVLQVPMHFVEQAAVALRGSSARSAGSRASPMSMCRTPSRSRRGDAAAALRAERRRDGALAAPRARQPERGGPVRFPAVASAPSGQSGHDGVSLCRQCRRCRRGLGQWLARPARRAGALAPQWRGCSALPRHHPSIRAAPRH